MGRSRGFVSGSKYQAFHPVRTWLRRLPPPPILCKEVPLFQWFATHVTLQSLLVIGLSHRVFSAKELRVKGGSFSLRGCGAA